MKNRLFFPIIFAFIFSSCSNFSGNEDEVEASLKPSKETVTTTTTMTYYDFQDTWQFIYETMRNIQI